MCQNFREVAVSFLAGIVSESGGTLLPHTLEELHSLVRFAENYVPGFPSEAFWTLGFDQATSMSFLVELSVEVATMGIQEQAVAA